MRDSFCVFLLLLFFWALVTGSISFTLELANASIALLFLWAIIGAAIRVATDDTDELVGAVLARPEYGPIAVRASSVVVFPPFLFFPWEIFHSSFTQIAEGIPLYGCHSISFRFQLDRVRFPCDNYISPRLRLQMVLLAAGGGRTECCILLFVGFLPPPPLLLRLCLHLRLPLPLPLPLRLLFPLPFPLSLPPLPSPGMSSGGGAEQEHPVPRGALAVRAHPDRIGPPLVAVRGTRCC